MDILMEERQIGNTNVKVGVLGLGCAPLGGNFVSLDSSQGAEVISSALEASITYFDTAPWYELVAQSDCLVIK